jgi:hypothetical protein
LGPGDELLLTQLCLTMGFPVTGCAEGLKDGTLARYLTGEEPRLAKHVAELAPFRDIVFYFKLFMSAEVHTAMKELRVVAAGFGTGWHRKWPSNEGQIPNFRAVREHASTGYNRVEGNRRASRNGRVTSSPTRNPLTSRFATVAGERTAGGEAMARRRRQPGVELNGANQPLHLTQRLTGRQTRQGHAGVCHACTHRVVTTNRAHPACCSLVVEPPPLAVRLTAECFLSLSLSLGRCALLRLGRRWHRAGSRRRRRSGPRGFCHRYESLPQQVFPTGDLGYRGVRVAVGLGYRFTV